MLHLAELSNISLDEAQIEPLIKDLDNIVKYGKVKPETVEETVR